ncbi:MAG TPA: methyltransferase, TIGR04325 family [Candidatus Rifleibacterium sp.]|mgnify:CR=1 FL=1|nr:methyltransferase, TIGR04325 family [Candidatus Rifleibacterium sp.]HPT47843.1 methyltransferase, TIGR04325 family [Candidatus Rifleibacterium sp.]
MNIQIIKLFKELIPPALLNLKRRLLVRRGIFFNGPFPSWKAAADESGSYDQEIILQKVRSAALMVKQGKAAFERDATPFQQYNFEWPVLSNLMWSAAREKGSLRVLDFGGSLGSSYFQNLPFLKHLPEIRWGVVEQPHYVKCGQTEIQNDNLLFFNDIESCSKSIKPDVILLGSVIQFLPEPYAALQQLIESGASTFIFDRTYFSAENQDAIYVQINPVCIYPADYPCWLLNERKISEFFDQNKFFSVSSFANGEFPALECFGASLKGWVFSRLLRP